MLRTSKRGMIPDATAETRGAEYDGALALCGAVAPTEEGARDRVLPLLAAFDYFFPDVLAAGARLDDASAPADIAPERIEAALVANEANAALLAKRFEIRREDLATHLRFYYVMLRELVVRGGGFPVGNEGVVYAGFGDDAEFNLGVRRYAAAESAAAYLRAHYTPSGRLAHPLMLGHTSYDPTVPPTAALRYQQLAESAGSAPLVVSRTTPGEGHCNFSAEQVGGAFDALVDWVEKGTRPGAGS
jgi:pimeloyl-ACP methyl ester carboxylesterase